jgi:hypothetical protein
MSLLRHRIDLRHVRQCIEIAARRSPTTGFTTSSIAPSRVNAVLLHFLILARSVLTSCAFPLL